MWCGCSRFYQTLIRPLYQFKWVWGVVPTSQWVMVHLGWFSRPSLNPKLPRNSFEMNHCEFVSHIKIMLQLFLSLWYHNYLKWLYRWSSTEDWQCFSQFCASVSFSSLYLTSTYILYLISQSELVGEQSPWVKPATSWFSLVISFTTFYLIGYTSLLWPSFFLSAQP